MGELYHGSFEQGIKRLEPHKSTHGNYVYATPYKELSIIFSGKSGDDCTYALYRKDKNEPWQMVERIPEAFNTMFNNSSSIYVLDDTTFKDISTGFAEVVSLVGVDTIREEHIENVYDEIKKLESEGKVQLYIYPNKSKKIPQDNSDLIDKQISQHKRNNKPITKDSFKRLILLHPNLLEKVNQKMDELNLNVEPYQKEDLINLFENAVIRQAIYPEKEQYLKSITISISNTYPELLPYFNEKLLFLDKTKEEKIAFVIDKIVTMFNDLPEESIRQLKERYSNDDRSFSEIGKEIMDFLNILLAEQDFKSKRDNSSVESNSVVSKNK